MIYVPVLKTRREEYNILEKMSGYFSEKIIPLIEVIAEKYQVRYKRDIQTGEYIYVQTQNKRMKVKETPTDKDQITLSNINNILKGKRVFIDYFRFSNEIYGNNVDLSRAELSWNISNDTELYKDKLRKIGEYPNMIPVISIKKYFVMGKKEIWELICEIQKNSFSMALRITEEWIEQYEDILKNVLRKEDFLLLDIGEQNPETKFMEIEQINDMQIAAQFILLNSPRKRDTKNAEFPEEGKTDLINNCARNIAEENDMDGYGDYCGLKDTMPLKDGSNGTGAALALFYSFRHNTFYSYSNHDTSKGMTGYRELIPKILRDKKVLDPDNDCMGFKKVEQMTGSGNWSTWHNINATRYIHQVFKYL